MYKKLHWICNSPSSYNNYLFDHLANNLPCKFQVHYLYVNGPECRSSIKNKNSYTWRLIKSAVFDKTLLKEARSKESLFVIGGWQKLVHISLFFIARGRYVVWTDTPQINKKRNMLKDCLRSIFLKFIFTHAKAVLGTGMPALKVLNQMGAPHDKLINFPYWVNTPDINLLVTEGRKDQFSILSVGRLIPVKAFGHLLELAAKLKNYGFGDFMIKLAGDGPEYQNLEKMIKEKKIESYVTLLGWLDNNDVLKEIQACDLFVHPAAFEPYGVVVLEAMAHGKPVIVSDCTMAGVDRIVTGKNGYLYKFGDIEELAKIVIHLMGDKDDRNRLGRNAYRTAMEWPVDKALTIVHNLLKN